MSGGWEEVTSEVAGFDSATGQVVRETVRTGRMRRPESVAEWSAQRVAAMGVTVRAMPAGRALAALLEAGEGFDVKAAARELDEHERHGVLLGLTRLLEAAREGYPPAAALMLQVRGAWIRAHGDREPRRRRIQAVKAPGGPRPSSLADSGADAAGVRASWDRFGDAVTARRAALAGLAS